MSFFSHFFSFLPYVSLFISFPFMSLCVYTVSVCTVERKRERERDRESYLRQGCQKFFSFLISPTGGPSPRSHVYYPNLLAKFEHSRLAQELFFGNMDGGMGGKFPCFPLRQSLFVCLCACIMCLSVCFTVFTSIHCVLLSFCHFSFVCFSAAMPPCYDWAVGTLCVCVCVLACACAVGRLAELSRAVGSSLVVADKEIF